MNVFSEVQVEPLLAAGFVVTSTLWLALSSFVVIDRLSYDRRQRQLGLMRRSLSDPALADLSRGERAAFVQQMLDRVPTYLIYRMTGDDELPAWVREEWQRTGKKPSSSDFVNRAIIQALNSAGT